jgi:murein DD-endopeptidase MepM/ murein hydrolase activator NlpD
MRQTEYRGYARGKGFKPEQATGMSSNFNPVQVADGTRKIAQRDAAYVEGMSRYASQLESNRNNYSQGLERKFNREESNRNDNFRWTQSEQQRYQESVLRNIDTERSNAVRALQNVGQDRSTLDALSSLSKTAANALVTLDKAKNEADQVEGLLFYYENGITPEMQQRYESQRGLLLQGEQQLNSVVNNLEFEGVPVAALEKFRAMSGWKRYGAMSAMVQQGADTYPMYALEQRDKLQFQVGDRLITLAEAQTPEEMRAGQAALRSEYLRRFTGVNPAMLAETLFPSISRFEASEYTQFSSQYEKRIDERLQGERSDKLRNLISVNGGQGLLEYIEVESGGDRNLKPAKRDEAFVVLKGFIEAGQLNDEEVNNILDHEFTPLGQSKTTTIGEHWATQGANELRSALFKRRREKASERDFQSDEDRKYFDQQVISKLMTEGASNTDIEAITKLYRQNGWQIPEILKSYQTREMMLDESAESALQALANRDLLTSQELYSGKYSEDMITKFRAAAERGDQTSGIPESVLKGQVGRLGADLAGRLKLDGQSRDSEEYLWAKAEAEDMFRAKAIGYIGQGMDPTTAAKRATEDVLKIIGEGFNSASGKPGTGPFGRTIEGEFLAKGKVSSFIKEADAIDEIRFQGKGVLNNRVRLDPETMRQLEMFQQGQTSQIPAQVLNWSRATNIPAIEIMNRQLAAAGKPPIKSRAEDTLNKLSPWVRQLVQSKPSISKTYQGFGMESANQGIEAYRPLLDLIASKESAGHGDYDAMNTGGFDTQPKGSANSRNVFPGGLTSRTVAEVMQLQDNGQVHASGRYQIIRTTLRGLMNGAYGPTGVKPTDLYDAATQDKLAIALVKGRAGRFFDGTGTLGNAIVGMGHEWSGLKPSQINPQKVEQALQTTRQRLNSTNWFRQVENMKPEVASAFASVSSWRKETPGANFQPGVDIFFEDKQFRALLSGVVKDIGKDKGYGNYIVVESVDPKTGDKVDLLYSHIDDSGLKAQIGQPVTPGQVIARQGGAGRVRSADGTIASVDFLAPAPRGSKSMVPYQRWSQLVDELKSQFNIRA